VDICGVLVIFLLMLYFICCVLREVTFVKIGSCKPEVEFLEEIQTEVLRVFLLAIHRHLY
jgi:hypothetical protein